MSTKTQTQLSKEEIERRAKILNDIAERVAAVTDNASKSVNSMLLVARAILDGVETGNTVEHAEKMTALFGEPTNLNQCSQQAERWKESSAAAIKSGNWASADAAYSAYVHCLGTLRIVAI